MTSTQCSPAYAAGIVHIANDAGQVAAVAAARPVAAYVRTKSSLGVVEVVEWLAAKRPHEPLARALHRSLGVDSFEEQPNRAIFGAGALAFQLRLAHSATLPHPIAISYRWATPHRRCQGRAPTTSTYLYYTT